MNTEIAAEIAAQLEYARSSERLTKLSISYHFDPGWESRSDDACLDVPKILKVKRSLNGAAAASISRLSIIGAPAHGEESLYVTLPMICTLWIEFADQVPVAKRERPKRLSALAAPGSPRPTMANVSMPAPTERDVIALVDQFMSDRHGKNAAAALAREVQFPRWKKLRPHRELLLLQMTSLVPVHKCFFGAGEGDEILKRALVKPQQRAKMAKRSKTALTRGEVVHTYWTEALSDKLNRQPPPFVKL